METLTVGTFNKADLFIIAARTLAVLFFALLSFVVLRSKVAEKWPVRWQLLLGFAIRIIALGLLYYVAAVRLPCDIISYKAHALATLHGQVPNRDFLTPYGWLFSYMLAGVLLLTGHIYGLIVFLQLCDFVGLALALGCARRFLSEGQVRTACTLYLLSPTVCVWYWFGAQGQTLLVLVLGAVMAFACRGNNWLAGFVAGMLFHCSKVLSMWMIVPFLLVKKVPTWIAFFLTTAAVYLVSVWAGAVPWNFKCTGGWESQNDDLTHMICRGNVWHWIELVYPQLPKTNIPLLGVATATGLACLWLTWIRRRSSMQEVMFVPAGSALLVVVFMVFSAMTQSYYLGPAILSMLVVLPASQKSARYVPWVVAWSTISMLHFNFNSLLERLSIGQVHVPVWARAGFAALDVLLVAMNVLMLWVLVWFLRPEERSEPWNRPAI